MSILDRAQAIFDANKHRLPSDLVSDPSVVALEVASLIVAQAPRSSSDIVGMVEQALPPNATLFEKGMAVGMAIALR